MRRRHKVPEYGDCHITIVNFGTTLRDSLQSLPSNSKLRLDIETLTALHAGRSFFVRPHWNPDDLWTLYALQEGVSRYNKGVDDIGTRGVGTADVIDFFQQLGKSQAAGSEPKMCIGADSQGHLLGQLVFFPGNARKVGSVARRG